MMKRCILIIIAILGASHSVCLAEIALPNSVAPKEFGGRIDRSDVGVLLRFANELRKMRNEEESRANERLDKIASEIENKANFKLAVVGTIFATFLSIFGCIICNFIKDIVRSKIRREFETYTSKKIDEEIIALSGDLKARIEKVDKQLDAVHLYSEALSGMSSSYNKLKKVAEGDSTAKALLGAVNMYYRAKLFRRGGDYTMEELFWRYKKVDESSNEIVRQISATERVTDNVVNQVLNLAVRDDGKKYAAILVEAALKCEDLNLMISIVDCLHALYEDCPQTPDASEIKAWWEVRKGMYGDLADGYTKL